MSGEILAVLAALAYGIAGVTIVKGRTAARGDNGVFLSVVVTAALTWILWLVWGQITARQLVRPDKLSAVTVFALAGLLSTVLGRVTMYRATECIGAVRTSLLRRLTPVFAMLCAFFLLAETPDARTLLGGGFVLVGVFSYWQRPAHGLGACLAPGLLLGAGSAFFYALAYTLRSLGLDALPDAALGTFIGALTGGLWFLIAAVVRHDPAAALRHLWSDHGRWHWATALALSAGQTLQFFALKSVPVAIVAILGTLEVFFAAGLVIALIETENVARVRLGIAATAATFGTVILVG